MTRCRRAARRPGLALGVRLPPDGGVIAVLRVKIAQIVENASRRAPTVRLDMPRDADSHLSGSIEHDGHQLVRGDAL